MLWANQGVVMVVSCQAIQPYIRGTGRLVERLGGHKKPKRKSGERAQGSVIVLFVCPPSSSKWISGISQRGVHTLRALHANNRMRPSSTHRPQNPTRLFATRFVLTICMVDKTGFAPRSCTFERFRSVIPPLNVIRQCENAKSKRNPDFQERRLRAEPSTPSTGPPSPVRGNY